MKEVKDNFSNQAHLYKKFRPVYPAALYQFILQQVKAQHAIWDCGTGNGQVANALASYFDQVYASDISEKQLSNAETRENIFYKVCRAEQTPFLDNQFDLITVAQAIHWFDFDAFYKEVRRTSKPGGVLAVWGYGLLRINNNVDKVLDTFYKDIIGPYWDKERKYIDESYVTIPFDFREITHNQIFQIEANWSLMELAGYLTTWSSVQKYIQEKNQNPIPEIIQKISSVWQKEEQKGVLFPVFLRIGVIDK